MADEPTMEELAQAVERGRRLHEEAETRVAELRPAWTAATARLRDTQSALKVATKALEAGKRHEGIRKAAEALGVSGVQTSYFAPVYGGVKVFYLVAVGPEGTPLYKSQGEGRRYGGPEHAIPRAAAPDGARDMGVHLTAVGLVLWETWGLGYRGARKPLPPPEGGRWRWLKVREQEELTA